MKPITEKYHLIDEWRQHLNIISNNVGDPSSLYITDGVSSPDSFIHPVNDLVVSALNDLNTRKVKRSGDTIAFLNVTGNLSVGNVTSDLKVATNKFVVASASGNTTIAGTLGVAGSATFAALSATGLTINGASNLNGALNVSGLVTLSNTLILNGGVSTVNDPMIQASQTWNNANAVFYGVNFDITNTASSPDSLLLNFTLSGKNKFGVDANGTIRQFVTGSFLARDIVAKDLTIVPNAKHIREYQDLDDGLISGTQGLTPGSVTEFGFTYNAKWNTATSLYVKDNVDDHSFSYRFTEDFKHEWWFSDGTTPGSTIQWVKKVAYDFLANQYSFGRNANLTIAENGFNGSLTVFGTGSFSGALAAGRTTLSGGTVVDLSSPVINATQTWNTAQRVDGISLDVTNTASGANSYLIHLKVGGVSKFAIDVQGNIKFANWAGGLVAPSAGGTGINNGTNTITVAGNFSTVGANALTLTTTGATNITLPTTGTLATLAGAETLSNKTLAATTMSGTLTLAVGTTSNAPVKFQAGQILTAAQAHAFEWDGTSLYMTNSAATRKMVQFTDGSNASGSWGISVTGTASNITGIAALANGGTGSNLTASNGGIVYSGVSGLSILAGNATAGRMLFSGATSAPTWSAYTMPSVIGAAGKLLRSDGTNIAFSTLTMPDTISANAMFYATALNTVGSLIGTANQYLSVTAAGVPTFKTLAAGTGISIVHTDAGMTITATGTFGATDITGTFQVRRIADNVVVAQIAEATGNATFNGTLTVGGASQLNGDLTIGANKILFNSTTGAITALGLTVNGNVLMNSIGSTVTILNLASTTSDIGTAVAITSGADTFNTRVATTAWYNGQFGATLPVMNGAASAGVATRHSRADHVHPTDTSRAPVNNANLTGVVGINTESDIQTATVTTTAIAAAPLAQLPIASYRSAEFIVQAVDTVGVKYHSVTIKAIHDGVNAFYTEYAAITGANGVCATFTVDVTGGNLRLVATPASASSTVFKVTAIATKI